MNEKILASVGGKNITEAEVDAMILAMGQNGQRFNNPQGRAIVLEQLINQRLFLMDAARNLYEREPAFKAEMAKVKDDLLTNYAISKVIDPIQVSDTDAKAFYDENPDQFAGQPTVNASHILVDSEEKANAILEQIKAGSISFEDAAKENSSCPSSAQGGNLGDFGRGQMVPEFDTACFSMEVGEISAPVKTQFGYHLIKLNSKADATPLKFSDVRDQIKAQLLNEKQKEAYQRKINQLKILYPVDKF